MIKSVAIEIGWNPREIKELYIDDEDFEGLEYWYDTIVKLSKKTSGKK